MYASYNVRSSPRLEPQLRNAHRIWVTNHVSFQLYFTVKVFEFRQISPMVCKKLFPFPASMRWFSVFFADQ